jgi:hypothetical protein
MPACCIQFSDVRILHDIHFQSLVTGVIAAGGVSSATIQPGDYCVNGAGYSAVATTTVNDCYIAEPEVCQCRCTPAVACTRSMAGRGHRRSFMRNFVLKGTLCALFVGRGPPRLTCAFPWRCMAELGPDAVVRPALLLPRWLPGSCSLTPHAPFVVSTRSLGATRTRAGLFHPVLGLF